MSTATLPPKKESSVTPERIMQMAWGFAAPLIIESAVKYRFFDHVHDGADTPEAIAGKEEINPRATRMLMDALVGFELLAKDDGRYKLTPESDAFLRSAEPSFQGGFFRHISTQLVSRWIQLDDVVRTGEPVVAVDQQDQGADFFAEFVEAIFPFNYQAAKTAAEEVLGKKDSGQPFRVLDIAAGSGVWSIAFAQRSANVQATAVDWPKVLEVTRRVVERQKLSDRYSFIAGDILEVDFGTGYQAATLGHILHSEGAKRSRTLLEKVFKALAPGGTVVIGEFNPNEDRTGPPNALIFAVNMLVNTTVGDVFTFGEISRWLKDIGFTNPRQLEAPAPSPLILADRP